jgi:ATP-dependent Clp protease ATP-binding subunit ClpC
MNESTLTQLKILVERAVRPVRASMSHKRKMREELLAHVTAVFEEEAASLGDEGAALERTGQRFGNPAELTGQFQESVPASDRLALFLEQVFVRTSASPLRLALRYTLLTLFFPAILLSAYVMQGRMSEWPIAVAAAVLAFVCVILVDGLRDALFGPAGRSWRKAALVSVASWFLIPGATFALCLTFSGDVSSSLMDVLPLLPAALLSPAALISPACAFAVDARSQREWASLPIS